MMNLLKGNLFDDKSDALVNTINCFGAMGKGIALEFKNKFPDMFAKYKEDCANNLVQVGKMNVWENPNGNPKWIINFPTKHHWKYNSRMEWIVEGLQDLVEVIKEKGITSIGIPPLGCGNGKLIWAQVLNEIKRVHDHHWKDIQVNIYEPTTPY